MALVARGSDLRRWAGIAMLAAGWVCCGSLARADVPEIAPSAKARPPKTAAAKAPPKAATDMRKPAPPQDAISPRWIGPTWEIKGLTVWVFKPGHFEGR